MLLSLIFGGVLAFQSLPPNGSVQYLLHEFKPDGNNSYVDLNWSFVEAGEGQKMETSCVNRCNGNVHFAHANCDLTCDTTCKKGVHTCNFPPLETGNTGFEYSRHLDADLDKFGTPVDGRVAVGNVLKSAREAFANAKYTVPFNARCWNTAPCSYSYKGFKSKRINVVVSYQMTRKEKGPDGREIVVKGPNYSSTMATFDVADPNSPSLESREDCSCAIIKEGQVDPENEHSSIGGIKNEKNENWLAADLDKYKFSIQFNDMNSYSVTATNTTMLPVTFIILPGTVCAPTSSLFQDMMITEPTRFTVPPMWLSLTPNGGSTIIQSKKAAAVCLNMRKKEPDPSVVYKPSSVPTYELEKLAKFARDEASRGSWTQSRIWILTDHAKLDEIQNILNPGPTEGHYLRSLYQVATLTSTDFTDGDAKRCLEPRLITGASATTEGTQWFVKIMEKVDPKALSQYVIDNPDSFESLFVARAGALGLGHAVDVANALLMSSNAALQKAGMHYLQHAIPKERMADFVGAGGLSGLNLLLDSEKPETASAAMDVAEAMPYKALTIGLCNLPKGASPELRERASKLLKNLK